MMQQNDVTNKQPLKSGVGGWLLLFCISLTIAVPLRAVYDYYDIYSDYDSLKMFFVESPSYKNIFFISITLDFMMLILSIRAGIALWRIKEGAVRMTKNYLLISLWVGIVSIFLFFTAELPPESNEVMKQEAFKNFDGTLLYVGVWYIYLCRSTRVKATYYSIHH